MSEEEGIFLAHEDYISILFALNISDDKKQDFTQKYISKVKEVFKGTQAEETISGFLNQNISLKDLAHIMGQIMNAGSQTESDAIRKIRQEMFDELVFPKKDIKNTSLVYRVGTFLLYYISYL